jgi:hypothetical protein
MSNKNNLFSFGIRKEQEPPDGNNVINFKWAFAFPCAIYITIKTIKDIPVLQSGFCGFHDIKSYDHFVPMNKE